MKPSTFLIVLFNVLCSFQSNAQLFTNYTVASTSDGTNGLVYDGINDIYIDTEGNVWFNTMWGITKYDGKNWTTTTLVDTVNHPINTIKGILVDNNENLWAYLVYAWHREWCLSIPLLKSDGTNMTYFYSDNGLFSGNVWDLTMDNEGNIWIVCFECLDINDFEMHSGGVSKFDGTGWTTYTVENGLAGNNVFSVEFDKEGNGWFGTDGGVSKFDGYNWTSFTTKDGLPDNNIYDIAIDSYQNKWFVIHDSLNNYKLTKFDDTDFSSFPIALNGIRTGIVIDLSGNVWYGTSNGLCKYNGTEIRTFTTKNGLVNDKVYSIAIDYSNGNIWIGTSGGVSKLTRYDTEIKLIRKKDNTLNIFPNPGNGIFRLDLENPENCELKVYSIGGRLVFTRHLTTDNEKIDLSAYPKGIYLIKVNYRDGVKFGKLIFK